MLIQGVTLVFGWAESKDENIGFDGYISTWILRIYRRYIDGYFYINIDN